MKRLRFLEACTIGVAGRKGKVGFNGVSIPFGLTPQSAPFGVQKLALQDQKLSFFAINAGRPVAHKVIQRFGCALKLARGEVQFGSVPCLGLQFAAQRIDHGIAGVFLDRVRVSVQKQLQFVHGRAGVALVQVGLW